VLPAFMNTFLAMGLLLDRRPERSRFADGDFPGVTILIAVRNEEDTILGTLASIAAQRYPAPLEVMVINDGSTDGTRIAAAWESGMDNAVRFDGATMVSNGDGAWSLDQESVDLNAYLYREKLDLAELAGALGKAEDRYMWLKEAEAMKPLIQQRMFDAKAGYFFDIRLTNHQPVRVYGSEGWAPLWAGAATPEQASAVRRVMLDPDKFATVMPFPTLARDDPHFSPIKGYWRGPVWMDQAYFGVEALKRYGFHRDANDMARRLVMNAQGVTGQGTTYENYDPLTGHGYQSPNFSWSAASYLMLLRDTGDVSAAGQSAGLN